MNDDSASRIPTETPGSPKVRPHSVAYRYRLYRTPTDPNVNAQNLHMSASGGVPEGVAAAEAGKPSIRRAADRERDLPFRRQPVTIE